MGLLLAGLTLGCTPQNAFVEPPPPSVTVAHPTEQYITDTIEFTGVTQASATVELRARVSGYLQEIGFQDGDFVAENQVLFVIDPAPFEAELAAANANLEKARAALQLAEANLARTSDLSRTNAVARQQLDVDRAEKATAEANVKAAQAAVTQAALNLSYTKVRAPMAGRIGRHLIDKGNLVHTEQSLLAVLERLDPIYAVFYPSESDMLRFMAMVREGLLPDPRTTPTPLRLGLANDEGFPHEGYLEYREFGVDPATGTTLRRATFPNKDLTLAPGMFVRIQAGLGGPVPRLTIAERAIGADQRGDYVRVVVKNDKNEDIVEERLVQLGPLLDGRRVILKGVNEDDRVVVNGLQQARPGFKVNANDPTATPPEAVAEDDLAKTAPAPPKEPEKISVSPASASKVTPANSEETSQPD
jgi:RND family efflux transporter MFP subunit